MSKKIFFIVLTCCLLVATFCVSFAGAPQVQSAPADIRAVLDRPDCAAAPLIVPPVVEPPLMDFVVPDSMVGTWYVDFDYAADLPVDAPYTIGFSSNNEEDYIVVFVDSEVRYFSYLNFFFTSDGFYVEAEDYDATSLVTFDFSFTFEVLDAPLPFFFTDFRDGEHLTLVPFPDGFLSRVSESPSGVEIVGSIVGILMSGLVETGEAMGEAFSVLAESIFINTDGTGLSTFGILVVVFAAVSLGLSLTRWTLNFCSSWGKRNR